MRKCQFLLLLLSTILICAPLNAQTMRLSTSSADYEVTNIVSDVDTFDFEIVIDAPLAAGLYDNPPLITVSYRVSGDLLEGTPSGFEAFALERIITGEEFYAQGSTLRFEIDEAAVLNDGVQIAELVGTDVVFRFDGREIDNGRFHPALFVLQANGAGRIQNSNNTPNLDPLLQIGFGTEYINDLNFDPGNTTVITRTVDTGSNNEEVNLTSSSSNGGFGGVSLMEWLALLYVVVQLRYFKSNSTRKI